jgi:ATP-dependent DNA helicase RecQ
MANRSALAIAKPRFGSETPSMHEAQRVLETVFGYKSFRLEQGAIIETLVAGGDALVLIRFRRWFGPAWASSSRR